MKNIMIPLLNDHKTDYTINILTKNEIKKILEVIDNTIYSRLFDWNEFLRERNKLMIKLGYTLALRPKEIVETKIEHIEYLFPGKYSKHVSTSRFRTIFREACRKAGIYRIKGVNAKGQILSITKPYSLRHTKATEILLKTNNIFYTALYLGHSNLNSTLKYLHIVKDFLAELQDKI